MQRYTFTTSVPQTDEIVPERFVAATCANEMNLTGSFRLRGALIAFDAYVSRTGTGLSGTFLKNGEVVTRQLKCSIVVVDGGTPWWESATVEERDLVGRFLLRLRDYVNTHEQQNPIPTSSGSTKQYYSPYPLDWVPEIIWTRINTLADWYRFIVASGYDGKPNAENRRRARYAKYWESISQAERNVMWKIHPTITRPTTLPQARPKYRQPTQAEIDALHALEFTLNQHYVSTADLIETLHLMENNEPELPRLPDTFFQNAAQVLACSGCWRVTKTMLGAFPDHVNVWPQIIQDIIESMLTVRINAAANGWTLLWPPATVQLNGPEVAHRTAHFKQLSVAVDSAFAEAS